MTPKQELQLKKLGPFSIAQAKKIGISHQELSRLVKKERINRLERGIYIHSDGNFPREIDFQIACKKFGPQSAVGGLTALFYYNLADQVPGQMWMIVPPEKRASSKLYRLIRTKTPLDKGVIAESGYRIVSIERAIVEAFKLASKIGERNAIKAARIAIKNKQTTLRKIGMMAKELGLESYLTKHFEAIVGATEE